MQIHRKPVMRAREEDRVYNSWKLDRVQYFYRFMKVETLSCIVVSLSKLFRNCQWVYIQGEVYKMTIFCSKFEGVLFNIVV